MDIIRVFVLVLTVCVVGYVQCGGCPASQSYRKSVWDSHLLDEGILPQITVVSLPAWATPHWAVLREWARSQDLS